MTNVALNSSHLVSLLLIGIAAWGIGFGLISSFRVVGVAIAVGIFLFLIALVGLIGAVKHHQVLLFFFSVSCACLTLNKDQQAFVVDLGTYLNSSAHQEFISVSPILELQKNLLKSHLHFLLPPEPLEMTTVFENGATKRQSLRSTETYWMLIPQSQLLEVGWNNTNTAKQDIERNLNCCGFRNVSKDGHCLAPCFQGSHCSPCAPIIEEYSGMVLRFVGGIGLFFSFTELYIT
ncbi:UNVERIFIED_CONTAM: hypothetical protein K2H54_037190 [Gekko kuhli]